jgi:hypothetical protein
MTELGKAAIEIVLMAGMIYAILWFVRRTTGAEILQGAAFFFAVALVAIAVTADVLGLRQLHFLFEKISGIFMIALLIGLQPEIRRGLMRLGAATTNRSARASVIRELTTALNTLSRLKIGALIAIENGVGLQNYIERTPGQLDAIVSAQLLETIFQPGQAVHDSASEPATSVTTGRVSEKGNATSVPHLNGVAELPSDVNSSAGAVGAACSSVRLPGVPTCSRPSPRSAGRPAMPASAKPSSVQGPRSRRKTCVASVSGRPA